jgi:hypothetical protein
MASFKAPAGPLPIRIPMEAKPWGTRESAPHTPDGRRLTFGGHHA